MAFRWWQTLKELVTRTQGDDDLAREIRAHLDEEADDRIDGGADPEEARYASRRAFGNVTRVQERTRDAWAWERLAGALRRLPGDTLQDVRYGVRRLLQQPGFTAAAVVALALGIGATTTIFSVIQNVLLDPYPMYRHVDRMVGVMIHDDASSRPGGRDWFETSEFLDYASQMTSFDAVIAGGGDGDVIYTGPEGAEQFAGALLSGNTFSVMGVDAIAGRTLAPDDAAPGAAPVFVMSYKLWMNRFGLDPSHIGRSFTLDGVPTTLVGVMPPRVSKMGADIWRPVRLDRADPRQHNRYFRFQARLKPGVTLEQADAEFRTVAARIGQAHPRNYPERFTGRVVAFVDSIVRGFRATLYTMAAAVGLLLLIACANVANLLLSRAAGRQHELALRSSLGASRRRLVRELFIESLLLAFAGMAAGCGVAAVAIKALVAGMPDGLIPRESLIRLDTRVLIFSLAVTGLTALIFGLVPALQAVRRDLMNPLRTTGKGVGGFRGGRLRSGLVVAEIALSLVLLTSAGVLMRSFIRLQSTNLGFDPANVLVTRVPLGTGRVATAGDQTRFVTEALSRIRSLPGVIDASTTTGTPAFGGYGVEFDVLGFAHSERWRGWAELCSDRRFQTLRVPLLRGRDFTPDDVTAGRRVAIVNRVFVERFLKHADPIGRTLVLSLRNDERLMEEHLYEIVGVAENARNAGVTDPIQAEAFVPQSAAPVPSVNFVVRTAGPPLYARRSVQREIWAVDASVAVADADALETILTRFAYAAPRLGLAVFTGFASIGLVLVVLGVYSLIAYTVSCQTREIGIRIAVGAARWDVLRMTIGMAVRWLAMGTAAGLAASYATTRLVASQLFEVSPTDPLTFAAVVGIVAAAGFAASYIPARRATKVDPIVVLRAE